MVQDLRIALANGRLCESTCRRHKMDYDTLCDRVEAWRDDPMNARRCMAIDEVSGDIAQLSNVLIPDVCWRPGLHETLTNRLCAIQSAIDMLKTRSCKDANSFGDILEAVRSFYSEPRNWPFEFWDEHISMMLAVLKHATDKSCRVADYRSACDESKTCYGRIAEALDQAFMYQGRDLGDVSEQTNDLFKIFEMVYEDAVALLCYEMCKQRDPGRKAAFCMSTLGEPFQYPSQSTSSSSSSSSRVRTKMQTPDSDIDDEDDDPREPNKCGAKKATGPEICACRTITRKMWQLDQKAAESAQVAREKLTKPAESGHNQYWRTTKPLHSSPLGQFVETEQ